MDKRKWRLLHTAIAGLCVCISVLAVSVFAAVRVNVNTTASVSYTAMAVDALLKVNVKNGDSTKDSVNDIINTAYVTYGSPQQNTSCKNIDVQFADIQRADDPTTFGSSLAITLADNDKDLFILEGSCFFIDFTITPDMINGNQIFFYFKIEDLDETNFAVSYRIDAIGAYTTYADSRVKNNTAITAGTVISFKYTATENICETLTTASVGNYHIYMSNTTERLQALIDEEKNKTN